MLRPPLASALARRDTAVHLTDRTHPHVHLSTHSRHYYSDVVRIERKRTRA